MRGGPEIHPGRCRPTSRDQVSSGVGIEVRVLLSGPATLPVASLFRAQAAQEMFNIMSAFPDQPQAGEVGIDHPAAAC